MFVIISGRPLMKTRRMKVKALVCKVKLQEGIGMNKNNKNKMGTSVSQSKKKSGQNTYHKMKIMMNKNLCRSQI